MEKVGDDDRNKSGDGSHCDFYFICSWKDWPVLQLVQLIL
jgi:hypothetical protein